MRCCANQIVDQPNDVPSRERFRRIRLEPISTTTKLQPPTYRNQTLEKIIKEQRDGSSVDLSSEELTADDMEIVAYYLLKDNMVRHHVFCPARRWLS